MGEAGSVKWMFDQKGVIALGLNNKNKEELELIAIDSGAEDIRRKNDILEVYTKPENLEKTKNNLEKSGIKIEDVSLDWVPKNELKVDDPSLKKQLENLFEALDENEDVKEIYSNINL
jgi:transcriptional/translational regulatory protein YebC/TACO1